MNDEDKPIFDRLSTELGNAQTRVERDNRYYDGTFRLAALGMSLPPEMRQLQTVLNWPRLVVSALEERLDIEGFRVGRTSDVDDELQEWWELNDLAYQSTLVHTEALVTGRGYVSIGWDDEADAPRVVAESARNMITLSDPRTGNPRYGLRKYGGRNHSYAREDEPERATLYLPDRNVYLVRGRRGWQTDPDIPELRHNIGTPLALPILHRARLDNHHGRSSFADVCGLTDAACRSMTNLQGAQELMAVPQRVLFGMSSSDFVDNEGKPIPKWEAYLGRLLAVPDAQGKATEFQAAPLNNFHSTITTYARHVASLTGLPLRYLGVVSESNPTGADAIIADQDRLIKTSERNARGFSSHWRRVMQTSRKLAHGDDYEPEHVEVLWRDPATNTMSAMADYAVKLYSAQSPTEGPLLPRREVQRLLGYTPEQIERIEDEYQEQDSALIKALTLESNADEPSGNASGAGEASSSVANSDGAQP